MKHGSLFSGIGGFDLAAEWMGWENLFHCEWNPFGRRILHHYWPNAESFNDITKTDFKPYANRIDILTGGFPCQSYSLAGKRKGKDDERHLWPEMLRAIREIQPRWVVGENVFGLINWSGGLVFHEVQTDLEAEGYEVFPYVLPAAAVNAPHRRDRVWFVAHTTRERTGRLRNESSAERSRSGNELSGIGGGIHGSERLNSDTSSEGLQRSKNDRSIESSRTKWEQQPTGHFCTTWKNFPTQPPICGRNDGLPTKLDGITFSNWRNESIKAAGNAIVPQVAYQIFKVIEQYENL